MQICKKCKKSIYPPAFSINWCPTTPPTRYIDGTTNYCECKKPVIKKKGKLTK